MIFAWQNTVMADLALPGLRLAPVELADEVAKFDLSLVLQEFDSGIAGSLTYARDLFDAPTIDRLAASFSVLLKAVVEVQLPVAQLRSSVPANGIQLVVESGTTRGRPSPGRRSCISSSRRRRRGPPRRSPRSLPGAS